MVLRYVDTEIFAEGLGDKIFDPEIVTALVSALGDLDPYVRSSVVNLFTAATAQGAVRCFHGRMTLKYSQRGCGTRYLTLRSSPHLYVY